MKIKVDIIIPVYNEERTLEANIEILRSFLEGNFNYEYGIIVIDTASRDKTSEIVTKRLLKKYSNVFYCYLSKRGRGRGLKQAWLKSQADIISYMDADLSTGLEAFPQMIDFLVKGEYDIVVGSRLMPGSKVKRCLRREKVSRVYNFLVRSLLTTCQFSDAQCGFKALTRKVANELLPIIKNQNWFFDTELLVQAERKGYRIKDIPVNWVENSDSRVNMFSAICEDIFGILRLLVRRTDAG